MIPTASLTWLSFGMTRSKPTQGSWEKVFAAPQAN